MTTTITASLRQLNRHLNDLASPFGSRWWMIGVLLLAALLRFHDLTLQSLWFDELMTWQRSSVSTPIQVIAGAAEDVWSPGYPLFMFLIIKSIGSSEFIMRFPAALGGVLSAAVIYTLGRRLAGHWAGLIASVLISVLQIAVYYSQEARPYSGVILYTILSSYFWLRIMQAVAADQRPRSFDLAGYVISALLLLYWNYFGLVMIALQGLAAGLWLLRHPRRWFTLLLMYGLIALGFTPWLGEVLHDMGLGLNFAQTVGSYTDELLAYFRFLLNLEHRFVVWAIWLVGAAILAEGWRVLARRDRPSLGMWLLLLGWLVLPFSMAYLRSVTSGSSLIVHRYLLISLPAACLLIGVALARLPLPRWIMPLAAAILCIGLIHNLMYRKNYYAYISKAQFRQAVEYVAAHDPDLPSEALIIGYTGFPGTDTHFNYYFDQLGLDRRVQMEGSMIEENAMLTVDARYLWLVSAATPVPPDLLDALMRHYTLADHQRFHDAEVWLFERKHP